jgi:hypothetical protein
MARKLIIAAPVSGLTKPDFGFKLYDRLGALQADPGIVVAEIVPGHYEVSGVPEATGGAAAFSLTYRVQPYVAGVRRWPEQMLRPPAALILPFGVGASVGLSLYRDEEAYEPHGLTVSEPEPGDHLVTGFPVDTGRWKLIAETDDQVAEVDWQGVPPTNTLPHETVMRRIIMKYLRPRWSLSPITFQGLIFKPDSSTDTAPWTPDEVRHSVGYVVVRFNEIDRTPSGVTSGVNSATGSFEYELEARVELQCEIVVPAGVGLDRDEKLADALENLLIGLRVEHETAPVLHVRQEPSSPPEREWMRQEQADRNEWRRSTLTVPLTRRERRVLVGTQEVLP